jgi:hypothetical protein
MTKDKLLAAIKRTWETLNIVIAQLSKRQPTKDELVAAIDRTWAALNTVLDQLSEAQMTTPLYPGDWTVKDHIVNITYWEKWVVCLLLGKSCCETFGIDRDTYYLYSDELVNQAIWQRTKDIPLAEVLADFRATHQQMLHLIEPLSDDTLQRPCSEQTPDKWEGNWPVIDVIIENTIDSYFENLHGIESLVTKR